MANGHWFEKEMEKAEEEVRQHGYEKAEVRAVMLMGFKYMTEQQQPLNLQLKGKAMMGAAMTVGGTIVGVIQALIS